MSDKPITPLQGAHAQSYIMNAWGLHSVGVLMVPVGDILRERRPPESSVHKGGEYMAVGQALSDGSVWWWDDTTRDWLPWAPPLVPLVDSGDAPGRAAWPE